MAVSLRQFVENLVQSGLMAADEVSTFRETLPPNRQTADAQALARELILAGKLTKYQAQCVYQAKTKGLVLGEYVVLDKIGEGGMGQVLKARHRTMERIVALKILPPKSVDSPEAIKRFRREVQAAARLTHPNIVMAYDAGEHAGIHFLAMEYVEGKDLASVIKERGPLELARALDYTLQTARGLAFAHAEGVIHRDIKPGNLLVDKKGTVKILDMGLARLALPAGTSEPGGERLTQSGQVMGTCDYMAPEQAYDTHRADHRSDIYSLGCTLHRLLTGNPPYSRDTLMQILLAHREARIPSVRDARPDVPERVDEVFQKMVAKEPEARQQSMAEVIADLEACLRPITSPAMASSVPAESLSSAVSDSLLQNLSFLQESVPPPLPGRRGRAASRDDTPRPAAYDQTGASIATKIKQAIAASGPKPLALLAVAGASALLVVVVALVLNFAGRGPTSNRRLPPGASRGEGTPGKALASGIPSVSTLPKPKGAAPSLAIAPFAAAARKHQEAWADYLGVPVELTNSIGMKFVLVPPGEFAMGAPQEEVAGVLAKSRDTEPYYHRDSPQHRVRISKPFWLGMHEVTVGQFRRYVEDTGYKTEGERSGKGGQGFAVPLERRSFQPELTWRTPGFDQSDDHPVVNVSWNDAREFCEWISGKEGKVYRLPTEAEWEGACRAGTATRYWSGEDAETLAEVANSADAEFLRKFPDWKRPTVTGNDHFANTSPVGRFRPNPWGLFDMHGNVWEWCADWLDVAYYDQSPLQDPVGPASGTQRVIRGGCWIAWPDLVRSASRGGAPPDSCSVDAGFRVACGVLAAAETPAETGEFPGLPQFPATPAAATPAPAAASPDGWSESVNLGPIVNSPHNEAGPGLSVDGLTLVFTSDRPGGEGGLDLWMCRRPSSRDPFGEPLNLGPRVNSSADDNEGRLSADGLMLLFESNRPGGQGGADLWMCRRASPGDPFGEPINLGSMANSSANDGSPALSFDGRTLVFGSDRPGGQGSWDLWVCKRASPGEAFRDAVNLGAAVNSSGHEGAPVLSQDGLILLFPSDRPGGHGGFDLWMATRLSANDPFGAPVNLGPPINTSALEGEPSLSADGRTLVFASDRPGGQGGLDLWMCTRPSRAGAAPPSSSPHPGPVPKGEDNEGPQKREGKRSPPPLAVAPFDAKQAKQHQAAWAECLGVPVKITNSIGITFVLIPPGAFDMGSPRELIEEEQAHGGDKWLLERLSGEGPQHRVRITRPFWLSATEVTQEEYERVTGGNPSDWRGDTKRPVDHVSWEDAMEFCRRLTALPDEKTAKRRYSLPTEAQWEYASRAGNPGPWFFSPQSGTLAAAESEKLLAEYGWFFANSGGQPHPVGQKRASPWGLYDIYGNVWEWCQDWYDLNYYAKSLEDNPPGPTAGSHRVLRGGGLDMGAGQCRSAHRLHFQPSFRAVLGFRSCLILPD